MAVGVGVIIGITLFGNSGRDNINIGGNEFSAGLVEVLENQVEEGGPIIYSDRGNDGDDNIYLSRLEDSTWTAFDVRRLGCGESLEWQAVPEVFFDPCEAGAVINVDGCLDTVVAGIQNGQGENGQDTEFSQLRHYDVRIEKDRVIVNLGQPDDGYCSPLS